MERVELGILAVVLGAIAGILLFLPFVAISYRRRGGLSFGRSMLWAGLLVYFIAIWTYTLLPLPSSEIVRCATPQLSVGVFVEDIRRAIGGPDPLLDPAVLQLVLNVLLFLPLGFFIRLLWHRGVVVSTLVGFGLSLLIETTQLTGVWGLYRCAYRLFDVDDLVTNTLGALLGALLSLLIPLRYRSKSDRSPDEALPRPVTRMRRIVGMVCDLLSVFLADLVTSVVILLVLTLVLGVSNADVDEGALDAVGDVVPFVITLAYILIAGRTIGHAAVQLRYVGGPLPLIVSRIFRFLGGIGGFQLLGFLPSPLGGWLQLLFAIGCLIAVFATKDRGGLPGLVSGQVLVDSRDAEAIRRIQAERSARQDRHFASS